MMLGSWAVYQGDYN